MLPLLCLLSVFCLTSSHPAETQTLVHSTDAAGTGGNVTFDDPQDQTAFSGLLNHSPYRDIAGVRSFPPEQEDESRIIGGQEAVPFSWPWQVSLTFASMPACGGAILSHQWVVSAAHCFRKFRKASYWTVVAGKHDLDDGSEKGQQVVGVAAIVPHHGYKPRNKLNDIALVKLQLPLVFSGSVRPIPVWTKDTPVLRECTITGWGATRENGPRVKRLQEVNVTVLPLEACNRFYSGRIRSSMFCAGNEMGGVDACQGDSGGPLSCFTGSRYELTGLVSWGVGCGRRRRPGVFTKLGTFAQWLYDHLNNLVFDEEAEAEETCGRQLSPGCPPPGLASLSVTSGGQVIRNNVTESCPFFWPWQVSLQSNGRHFCSGVLVHQRWVLAAKHCNVRANEDVAVLGVHDLQFFSTQTVPVDEVIDAPPETGFPPRSDLSLLRLSVPVRLDTNVSPVCLPEEDEELNDSWHCFTAGWDTTKTKGNTQSRLHHVGLSLTNRTTCEDRWGVDLISDTHLCAHPAGSASCMGDPGAPLYCRKRSAYFLFGVITWGSGRCEEDKPSVFTSTADYNAWISDVIDDD